MCGIIGVTGEADALPLLLGALHQLEYRGYDSAGVAVVADGAVWRARAAGGHDVGRHPGRAARPTCPAATSAAIGHTRWATHGSPTEENAHPHVDCTGRLALIHNGIIENHAELRAELEAAGHTIDVGHRHRGDGPPDRGEMAWRGGLSLAEATRVVLRRLRGSFSDRRDLGRRARHHRGRLPADAARPRARADGVAFLASDIPALIGHTRRVFTLDDDQLAVLTPGALSVTTLDGEPVEPEERTITWDLEAAQKGGYEDFMSKEIARAARRPSPTRCSTGAAPGDELFLDEMRLERRRAARHRQGLHRRLRLELPLRPGGQVRH